LVWRTIEVPSSMTLGELAPVLEAAMGWEGYHLHLFDVDGVTYGTPDPEWEADDLDESRYRLGDVLPSTGWSMRWDYDFGDGWEHTVEVEAVVPAEGGVAYPRCVGGERACPPEDCGGPSGYAKLVGILAHPNRPDPEHLREWVRYGFDPARFNLAATDRAVRASRPMEGWS